MSYLRISVEGSSQLRRVLSYFRRNVPFTCMVKFASYFFLVQPIALTTIGPFIRGKIRRVLHRMRLTY